ncbi:MAG: YbjN domain-containing protein [Clostridia bacterium]|nr:YbjN domain-containing protein [Clostridia bacterium]
MVICAQSFINTLNARGIHFSTSDTQGGGTCVHIPYDGRQTHVFFDGDDDGIHVALRTLFANCPEEKFAEALILCNELNVKYRWVKFCIDSDRDIMVEDDAVLTPSTAGEECFELLSRTAYILDDVKGLIFSTIYGNK